MEVVAVAGGGGTIESVPLTFPGRWALEYLNCSPKMLLGGGAKSKEFHKTFYPKLKVETSGLLCLVENHTYSPI